MGKRTRKTVEPSSGSKKKLVLKKETIRELAPVAEEELAGAAGGFYRGLYAPSTGAEPC